MDESDDDRALFKALADGDANAFRALYLRHRVRVYRFLWRMIGDRELADETLNEVFLAAWRGARRYEGRSAPLTWLLSIAHNKGADALRGRREKTETLDAAENIADGDDTPETAAQKRDKRKAILDAIGRLSREHRTILDLVYYQERSVAEVAEICGIPEGTVKTRMFHARKKLSEILAARGIDRGWP